MGGLGGSLLRWWEWVRVWVGLWYSTCATFVSLQRGVGVGDGGRLIVDLFAVGNRLVRTLCGTK
jgi:hypothetical protein